MAQTARRSSSNNACSCPTCATPCEASGTARGSRSWPILCLGFGIGLNTTIFSLVDGVLLQAYPFSDPDHILVLGEQNRQADDRAGLSFLDLRDWNESTSTFSAIAGSQGRPFTVSDGRAEPERHLGAAISWDLFPLLGTSPILGRAFASSRRSAECRRASSSSSYQLWTTRYQSSPEVIGRSIQVDAKPYTVIGVMPARFEFPENQRLWVPLTPLASSKDRDNRNLFVFGRLKPGVDAGAARPTISPRSRRGSSSDIPTTNTGWAPQVRTLREAFVPQDVSLVLYLMMGGVTLVLFIACSNVANLLLARAAGRRRELAVRAAIGAGRGRIIRQLLTESLVLGLASVPLGLLLAEAGTRLIAAGIPPDQVPYYVQWRVDGRSLALRDRPCGRHRVAVRAVPGASRLEGPVAGRAEGGEPRQRRRALAASQLARRRAGIVGACRARRRAAVHPQLRQPRSLQPWLRDRPADDHALLHGRRALSRRRRQDASGRGHHSPGRGAPGRRGGLFVQPDSDLRRRRRRRKWRSKDVPYPRRHDRDIALHRRHRALPPDARRFACRADATSPNPRAGSACPVAIINQTMAKRFWPDGDPIDRRFRLKSRDEWSLVHGDRHRTRHASVRHRPEQSVSRPPSAFVPYPYQETLSTGLTIRVHGDPASISAAARSQIRASDSNLAVLLGAHPRRRAQGRRTGSTASTGGSSERSASWACSLHR